MRRVLVTGSAGFIGRNLISVLRRDAGVELRGFDIVGDGGAAVDELASLVAWADIVFHLAGVNRPPDPSEFARGNAGLTSDVCAAAQRSPGRPAIILSSSIQAELDNPYGLSKRAAEEELRRYSESADAPAVAFRLPNVFGKWSRPNYNSAIATFCHNVARDLPITVTDPDRMMHLVYIDDVVSAFADLVHADLPKEFTFGQVEPVYEIALGELAQRIESFRRTRTDLVFPDMSDPLNRCLLATYNAFLPQEEWTYDLHQRPDNRGVLAEFAKSASFGQIFVSRTHPGIVRGNHYHHTKVEKFLVLEGEAEVRFREIGTDRIIPVRVSGRDFRVIDIPPGYTHCIENVGQTEMVVLFWASEPFDPARPDTVFEEVANA